MTTTQYYITATCCIRDSAVYRNGEQLVQVPDADTEKTMLALFEALQVSYMRFYKMDNLSKLGWLTAEYLLRETGIDQYQPETKGMILANNSSSLDTDTRYLSSVAEIASPALFVYTLPNIVTGEMSIRHQCKGETVFFVQERPDMNEIHAYTAQLFQDGDISACICGWIELLGDTYRSFLCLVESGQSAAAVSFTLQNLENAFNACG